MSDPTSTITKPRVLFVEDEETVRDQVALGLADEYVVDTAGDGAQALHAVLRNRPDVVITDLLMPHLDGVELVKTLRNTPSTATIPILMISGRAPDELRLEGFEGGADSFLQKPYAERELRVRLRAMLQAAQLRREEAQRTAQEQAEHDAVLERAALLESIADPFYATDRQWRVTYANQRALDYFNTSRESLIGAVLWDAFPADRGTLIESELKAVLRRQQPATFETALAGKWVEFHAYPTPRGVAVNFRDITDRKRAEAALRDSELRFRSMANAVPVLMWRADARNLGTWFNQSWLDFSGRTLADELGDGWAEIIHSDDRERARSACQAALDRLAPLEMELRMRRADGEYRWMLDRGMPVFDGPGGAFSGYIGTCADITDRKLVEEALRRRADEFTALADNIPQLCWMAYADGQVYWYNRRWYEYTGFLGESQAGLELESLHDPQALPQVKERWLKSLATGEPFEMTFPLKRADGTFAPFLTRVVAIRDAHGAIVRWFGTSTDVSEQLQTESQLRHFAATLEQRVEAAIAERQTALEQLAHSQKMEIIGQLTGGVAHDFNNLLTPIVGALDMLQRRLEGDTRAQRLTSGALQAADRARVLIQRLLAFARRQHLEARPVDIKLLLNGISGLLASTLGPQIKIAIQIQEPLSPARVDPNQLELALLNLALNARDAMSEGGSLEIVAKMDRAHEDLALAAGEYVSISVTDAGCGMDELTLRRAVEPFYTTKAAGQGTGLGLSMVHGLAAQSGGSLRLVSAPGQGTTATLLLPASNASIAPQASDAPRDQSENCLDTATILIVDDEPLVRISTMSMLNDAGYRCVEAASAQEALSIVKTGLQIDAVVTDYAMPGMTGAQLIQELRMLQPTIPVLLMTGYAGSKDREVIAGPRLMKPFRERDLTHAVAALLQRLDQSGMRAPMA